MGLKRPIQLIHEARGSNHNYNVWPRLKPNLRRVRPRTNKDDGAKQASKFTSINPLFPKKPKKKLKIKMKENPRVLLAAKNSRVSISAIGHGRNLGLRQLELSKGRRNSQSQYVTLFDPSNLIWFCYFIQYCLFSCPMALLDVVNLEIVDFFVQLAVSIVQADIFILVYSTRVSQ